MNTLSRCSLLVIALVAGCHREVTPAAPRASVSPDSDCALCGDTPIALGTPLRLATSWSGSCETGPDFSLGLGAYWGGGDTRDSTYSCNHVSFTTQVACANDACRVEERGNTVIPTKPGPLHVQVTMRPTSNAKPRTVQVEPVVVKTPERLDARCTIGDEQKFAHVEIELVNRSVLLYDPRELHVNVGGEACTSLVALGQREVVDWDPDAAPSLAHTYRCPVSSTSQLRIDAKSEGFEKSAWVNCR